LGSEPERCPDRPACKDGSVGRPMAEAHLLTRTGEQNSMVADDVTTSDDGKAQVTLPAFAAPVRELVA